MSNVELQELFTVNDCNANLGKIYVFGDNLMGVGCAGQAVIRHCENAYGIPTKKRPSTQPTDYFSDEFDEYEAVKKAIENILVLHVISSRTVVFPKYGLGTGLAKMKEHSPKLFRYMNQTLYNLFGVYHEYIS